MSPDDKKEEGRLKVFKIDKKTTDNYLAKEKTIDSIIAKLRKSKLLEKDKPGEIPESKRK